MGEFTVPIPAPLNRLPPGVAENGDGAKAAAGVEVGLTDPKAAAAAAAAALAGAGITTSWCRTGSADEGTGCVCREENAAVAVRGVPPPPLRVEPGPEEESCKKEEPGCAALAGSGSRGGGGCFPGSITDGAVRPPPVPVAVAIVPPTAGTLAADRGDDEAAAVPATGMPFMKRTPAGGLPATTTEAVPGAGGNSDVAVDGGDGVAEAGKGTSAFAGSFAPPRTVTEDVLVAPKLLGGVCTEPAAAGGLGADPSEDGVGMRVALAKRRSTLFSVGGAVVVVAASCGVLGLWLVVAATPGEAAEEGEDAAAAAAAAAMLVPERALNAFKELNAGINDMGCCCCCCDCRWPCCCCC